LYPSCHSFRRFQIFGCFLPVLLSSFPSIVQCLWQVCWRPTIYSQSQSAHPSVPHSAHFPLHWLPAALALALVVKPKYLVNEQPMGLVRVEQPEWLAALSLLFQETDCSQIFQVLWVPNAAKKHARPFVVVQS
jgi:hypothetical protein